jgi:hypothetical protein
VTKPKRVQEKGEMPAKQNESDVDKKNDSNKNE